MARTPVCDWPTLALIVIVSTGWAFLTGSYGILPAYLIFPLAAILITLHSSLQHEVLHGHPTRKPWLNEALIYFPIGLFVPYRRFKSLHLKHHNNDLLTDPYDDPESFYLAWADWQKLPKALKAVMVVNNTLAGRLLIGPLVSMVGFYGAELRLLFKNAPGVRRAWFHHLIGVAGVIWFVTSIAGMPLWLYVLAIAYPGMSLLMLRTFAEHRAYDTAEGRSIIVEFCPVFSLLFLNNNLHAVHHTHPRVAWYKLPDLYWRKRTDWHRRNHGYVYKSYFQLARRYFFKVKEPVPHPLRHRQVEARGGSVLS